MKLILLLSLFFSFLLFAGCLGMSWDVSRGCKSCRCLFSLFLFSFFLLLFAYLIPLLLPFLNCCRYDPPPSILSSSPRFLFLSRLSFVPSLSLLFSSLTYLHLPRSFGSPATYRNNGRLVIFNKEILIFNFHFKFSSTSLLFSFEILIFIFNL